MHYIQKYILLSFFSLLLYIHIEISKETKRQWYYVYPFFYSFFLRLLLLNPMLHLNERSIRKWTLGSCGASSIPVLFSALLHSPHFFLLSIYIVYFSVKYFRLYHRRDDNGSCSTDIDTKKGTSVSVSSPIVRQFFTFFSSSFSSFFSIDS